RGNGGLDRHKVHLPKTAYLGCYFCYYLISNTKPIKPAGTEGPAETWKNGTTRRLSPASRRTLDVRNRSRTVRRRPRNPQVLPISSRPCTSSTSHREGRV